MDDLNAKVITAFVNKYGNIEDIEEAELKDHIIKFSNTANDQLDMSKKSAYLHLVSMLTKQLDTRKATVDLQLLETVQKLQIATQTLDQTNQRLDLVNQELDSTKVGLQETKELLISKSEEYTVEEQFVVQFVASLCEKTGIKNVNISSFEDVKNLTKQILSRVNDLVTKEKNIRTNMGEELEF